MKRLLLALAITASLMALAPAGASAAFGINGFEVQFEDGEGGEARAGAHPHAINTAFATNFAGETEETLVPEGWIREFVAEQATGLVGDTTAYEPCPTAQFFEKADGSSEEPACPLSSQVGIVAVSLKNSGVILWGDSPVFSVAPPPGVLLRLGWTIATQNIFVDIRLNQSPPYNAIAASRNTVQSLPVFGVKLQLWGNPSSPAHDELRRGCAVSLTPAPPGDVKGIEFEGTGGHCPVQPNPKPFLTMPTDCSSPLLTSYAALSWNDLDGDGRPDTDAGQAANPALLGCGALRPLFGPEISARPTSRAASSPTGLDFDLEVDDQGLISQDGLRAPDIERAVVTLPEGMTANPSVAEGLEVCSESDLDDETLDSDPGEGCPQASKIGTLQVQSPLIGQTLEGSLYQATPHANLAGDSLIAFYMVFRNRDLGIIVKQPVRVEPDSETGQLEAIADDIPQLPFSSFSLHFREGGRSPLVSPPDCGRHEVSAELTPRSGGPAITTDSTFEIVAGPGGGDCPPGGTPPFEPGFAAGSASNAAGAFSPFFMRLTRRDGDQDLTRFDAILPPGVLAKLAGVSRCTDAQIARTDTKSGREEQRLPSCPPGSRIGTVRAGAGVGSQLTYVPGALYMAGPLGGAPLSVVAIVPAVAGPFDVGVVVTRQALRIDPRTGVVTADGALSEPIPHILAGIPLVVRDIQVYVDRPGFTLNPTSCDPMATQAGIWGGGSDPFSILDDAPALRAAPFQAASCQSLPYAPRLGLRLKGGTRRGAHPALRTVFRPRPGHANSSRVVVRFPRSAFVEQAHIRTICTRVQFAANACPKGSIYGRVAAFTPLLDQPLRGPVYLRSSNNELPDLVFDLHGEVDFEAVARIDSVKGALRAIAYGIPDAPIEKVVIRMQGGNKGLIVNSRNLCKGKNRARLGFHAHSAKRHKAAPAVRAQCKRRKARRSGHGRG